MTIQVGLAKREATARRSAALAPTCRGLNDCSVDRSVRDLPPLYTDAPLLAPLEAPVPLSRAIALPVK